MIDSELNNTNKIFRNLNIIFLALISGQLIYFVIGIVLIQSVDIQYSGDLTTLFMYLIPLVNMLIILTIKFIYSRILSKINTDMSVEKKSQYYLNNNIFKLALLESANLINVSAMIFTGNYFFAGFFVIITALYFLNRPTKEKFITECNLSSDDVLKIIS
jgi:hypothetical protein